MNPRRAIPASELGPLFDDAVRERAIAVLSMQTDDGWLTFKSRFLERDSQERFFVLDYQGTDGKPMPELIPGHCIGLSFRHRNRKLLGATVVEARGHFMVDNRASIAAVRYRWPESLTELQRRSYYRTELPPTMSLPAAIWRGGTLARAETQRASLQTLTGTLADLSCGGTLVRLNDPNPPSFSDQATVGVEIQLDDGKPPIILDAYARGVRRDELGQTCLALQFVGLELSVDGRLVLERLAGFLRKLHRVNLQSGNNVWERRGRA